MIDDTTQLHFPLSGSTELPLLFEPQLLRCPAVGPSGHPFTVLLDTGTDPSAIDLGLARRLGLRVGDFGLGQDAAGSDIPFTETTVPWLRLGDLQIRDLFALALDLRSAPFHVDMVLGYNVLHQIVLHIDYANLRLRLSHPDLGTAAASDATLLPLTFFEHFPALADVTLDGHMHLPLVTIDTGSNSGLTLSADLAQRLGLQPGAQATSLTEGTGFVSLAPSVVCGQVARMHLGPFALQDVELDTPGLNSGDLGRVGRANLGNRLLARFAGLTLDYGRQVCALRPGQG